MRNSVFGTVSSKNMKKSILLLCFFAVMAVGCCNDGNVDIDTDNHTPLSLYVIFQSETGKFLFYFPKGNTPNY